MNTPPTVSQPIDPRRRLRELLSVPERDRTDEQWDEIVELEIQLAPGNRVGPAGAGGPPMKNGPSPSGNSGNPQQQQPRKHRANKNNPGRRGPKPNKPPRDPSAA